MAQRGRPRTFDRDRALTSAMHLFWELGFDATSLSQLKAVMGNGISAPSFYAAFESKEALYGEAVELYLKIYGDVTRSLHDTSLVPRNGIHLALQRSVEMQFGTGHPRGCMVALGVMRLGSSSPGNTAIATLLQRARQRTCAGFRSCVERGIKSGELRKTTNPAALAAAFDGFFLGISALARNRARLADVQEAASEVMAIWDGAADR